VGKYVGSICVVFWFDFMGVFIVKDKINFLSRKFLEIRKRKKDFLGFFWILVIFVS